MNWDAKYDPDAREHRERPQRRKKNTRRWCKGKVGREHVPQIEFDHRYRTKCGPPPAWARRIIWTHDWWCHHIEVCVNCRKHLRDGWQLKNEECPDYPVRDAA